MASNGIPDGNGPRPPVRECYNCGQLGHISHFCPYPRANNGQRLSNALVPAQPIATYPPAPASNVGTSAPYYPNQYYGGGVGLGKRVGTLEAIVTRINNKQQTDEARERAEREEEENKKREREEEARREQEKKNREEFQQAMRQELITKLDVVREAVDGKKSAESEEMAKLRNQIEKLCKQKEPVVEKKKKEDADELWRMKQRMDEIQKGRNGSSTSTTVNQLAKDSEEIVRLRCEQEMAKTTMEKRLAAMKEVIVALQKQCEVAEANAEVWRCEALRPGNKRGAVVVGSTPASEARVRPRTTPLQTPCPAGRVNQQLKEVVDRNKQEVELLREMRLKEVNARKESEKEVERLKEEMARLRTGQKRGTNLRKKMDAVAGASGSKTKVAAASPVILVSQREAALKAARRELRNLKKDAVVGLCEDEGVPYTILDASKEALAQARADKAVAEEESSRDLGKPDTVVEVTDGEEKLSKDGACDSAES
ncbi:hypothetical protein CBR_g51664 [Chara braunii]|uniref:CCHC-type domain-containing protein n=1 Tax=Chara braunii TaxID=69332 RepID=A0A388M8Y5_CHABU|nr:hypothetical protein CBR_g51664 [Chara braunii]|eukprot:GBG91006.1 hypothetical protein CBR_g51664 [Chara braunii]